MTKIFTNEENHAWSKKLPGKMCSSCLILRFNEKVLMVKASYKDHWTFPSGIVDDNESPITAAIRETQEEVGLIIKEQDSRLFTIIYTASKDGDRDRFNFSFITDLKENNFALSVPNDEIAEAKWVNYERVAELSKNKGSYIQFQRLLLNPSDHSPYIEIK